MAKAHIVTENGTKLTIEGTPEEVAALVERIEGRTPGSEKPTRRKRRGSGAARKGRAKVGPANLIAELIDAGFFKKPRGLGAIRAALEERGHIYPVTTLSPLLLRLVQARQLRRIKQNKLWSYVR